LDGYATLRLYHGIGAFLEWVGSRKRELDADSLRFSDLLDF